MLIHPINQKRRDLNALQLSSITAFREDPEISYEEIQCCPLCNASDFSDIAEYDQFGIECKTVTCNSCSLMFSKNQLTEKATVIFYERYYRKIYEGVERASFDHGYYKKLYNGWVSSVPKFTTKHSLVAEIGCGGGWNLLPFSRQGIPHWGFDYDSDMVEFGKNKYGLNLFVGGLPEAKASGVNFDYIILSQVVEHLKDPVRFLTELRQCLKKRGLICITVPSLDYMHYFGGNSTHFDLEMNLQSAHNYVFSEFTLTALLRAAGYEPVLVLGGYALARPSKSNEVCPQAHERSPITNNLVRIIQWTPLKYSIKRFMPSFIYDNVFARAFYFRRPMTTLKYFLITKLGVI